MIKVCNKWTLEEFCEMDERDMEQLVRSFDPNLVPSFDEVRVREDEDDPNVVWKFDGSFGFSV